ncbi:MAG: hypothetical protein JOZ99_04770 [Actinobacteria bacterium]|nr:hypothetical protein [Actinomycetota bacterium]
MALMSRVRTTAGSRLVATARRLRQPWWRSPRAAGGLIFRRPDGRVVTGQGPPVDPDARARFLAVASRGTGAGFTSP